MNKQNIKLEDIGNRKPFEVPENYFTEFSARFNNQLDVQPVKFQKLIKPWMYMAAMFTGILLMGSVVTGVYNKNLNTKNDNYELYILSQLDEDVIYEYYMNDNNQSENISIEKSE